MKKFKLFIVGVSLIATWGCGSSTPVQDAGTANANASTPVAASTPVDEVAMGRELYKQNCAICHKEEGTGGKMTIEGKTIDPEDLTADKIKKFSDEKISGYIMNGVVDEGMPAFKDKLTEAQVKEIVAYVRKDIQKMTAAAPAR